MIYCVDEFLKKQFNNHLLDEMLLRVDKFFLCTTIDKTVQKNFYKINISFLCSPIDIV